METKQTQVNQSLLNRENKDLCELIRLSKHLQLENSERISYLLAHFVEKEHWKDILVILHLESKGDSLAFNGQDYGAMQINRIHIGTIANVDSVFYMDYNIKTAYNKIFVEWCLKDYNNRFKRYNGSMVYQKKAEKLLETL